MSEPWLRFLVGGWRLAWRDLLGALDAVLDPRVPLARLVIAPGVGLVSGWFLYVPVHELMHAAGCVAAGGSVTRLTLAPVYGASWLATVFPFIEASTDYAGRLTDFSTKGSDIIYLATDLAPYLLTVLIGAPLLHALAVRGPGAAGWRRWMFGPAAVLAAAPFLSVTGDYFEMATVLVTAPMGAGPRTMRSDDLFRLIGQLARSDIVVDHAVAIPITLACLGLSFLLVGWTYELGLAWWVTADRWRVRAFRGPRGRAS